MHLAQLNVARLRAPLGAPELRDFVTALEPINTLADASPGFVWRFQTADGDATTVRVLDDDLILVNMSVWETLEDLTAFVYRSGHAPVMRRRAEWFHRSEDAYQALWWIPSGQVPTVPDALARLDHLRSHGPTAEAFTFRSTFPSPDLERVERDEPR